MPTIYLKNENTLFFYYHEEIYQHSFDNFSEIIEEIKNDHKIKNCKISLILDFTKFYINFFNASEKTDKEEKESLALFLESEIEDYTEKNFVMKQFYLDHPQRKSMIFAIKREYINNISMILKKHNFILDVCKIDVLSVYEYFKDQNVSILNSGNDLSFILEIKDQKIKEFKIITMNEEDIHNIDSFDFIKEYENLIVLDSDMKNIETIFTGNTLYTSPNFYENNFFKFKKINIKPIFPYFIVLLVYFFINGLISYNKFETENKKIKQEIDQLQEELLNMKNNKENNDHTKELNELNEIIKSMRYQNHYKFFSFLIKEADKNIGYTKIIYDNNFWTIEGEADKFENIENFEEKLSKYAKNIELNFIKSENSSLIFQYKIGGILWN